MSQAAPQLGLRERKKQRTRQTIVDVALRLFSEQGYSETTLTQIADASDISPSTFFNYFSSKADIVFSLVDAVIASVRTRVVGRPEDEPAGEAIVAWIREDLGEVERPYTEAMRLIPRIVASDPDLAAEDRLRRALIEDAFAEAFAADFGEPRDGMRSRVLGAIALGAIIEIWHLWYEHHFADPEFDLAGLLSAKADFVEHALEAGIAAVATLPAPPADV